MDQYVTGEKQTATATRKRRTHVMGEHGNIVDRSNDWYTPAHVFDALGCTFDLDVAEPPEGPRYVPARTWLSDGGLEAEWSGFVWMNPPYGHEATKLEWLTKFLAHGNGIALMPDRTSASWWQWSAMQMDAVLFFTPKIQFERPDGEIGKQPGTGSTLMALGPVAVAALERAYFRGKGIMMRWVVPGDTTRFGLGSDGGMA